MENTESKQMKPHIKEQVTFINYKNHSAVEVCEYIP